MDFNDVVETRRSTRSFEPRAVPKETLARILSDAATAPPPFVGHEPAPWKFYVFEGVERIAGFGARAKQFAIEHGTGVTGLIELDGYKLFWDAPVVVIISGEAEDCSRAGMILLLSANAHGLGSCWVGSPMPWLRDSQTRAELGLAEEPGAALCLGFPTDKSATMPRRQPLVVWG